MMSLIQEKVLPFYLNTAVKEASVKKLGNGHINNTFLVTAKTEQFVLQKINTQVFTQPWLLVNNAQKISQHLLQKKQSHAYQLDVILPWQTLAGQLAIDLEQDGFWRAISYLPKSMSVEVVSCAEDAKIAAFSFGHFSDSLSDFNPNLIDDVIPKFHFLQGRLETLNTVAKNDCVMRLKSCQTWFDYVVSQQSLMEEIATISAQIPTRICHNDTKINNMLFNKTNHQAMAIIDLDTCMKGHLMYDFGDMVRTCCSPEAEDSTDLAKVTAREDIFSALCKGYLAALASNLTKIEKQSLWLGAKVMPFMIGVRFLTDYLQGDSYFQTAHPTHNLERAANQFTLYQSLIEQEDKFKNYLVSD